MIQTIDLRGRRPTRAELLAAVPRSLTDVSEASDAAAALIADVRARGTVALTEQAVRFDGAAPAHTRVPGESIARAVDSLDAAVRDALELAIDRVATVSRSQVPAPVTTTLLDGGTVTQRWSPIDRVGLYVPGGKAVYPSSVVMNVVPAQAAGVPSIALASPPQKAFGGEVHPTILAAAGLLGIDEVYAMGGAGAIGAFAYGVDDLGLDPVDLVTGPGNIYVAAAKRLVRGVIGIDSEAGPTEIVVIADAGADARLVAADLVSQAEHDEIAAAVLVTDSVDLAERVRHELDDLVPNAHHAARVRTALGGVQSAIVLVDDMGEAARFSNVYGPEHLELQTSDTPGLLALITNAGAVFEGEHSPVSLGDYLAGSNHVLPTGGQSRFSSGLGAYTFLRPQQVIRYSATALETVGRHVVALSEAEDLPAHGAAVSARLERP
ncbi:histidinol dehydrogenase [Marisediminicola sp. LYQ134]|uniref:histidinol dehydrogenase n=1 Tax=unclassified Marisediminicola TaxID=2618316 RepID=UPI003983AC64